MLTDTAVLPTPPALPLRQALDDLELAIHAWGTSQDGVRYLLLRFARVKALVQPREEEETI